MRRNSCLQIAIPHNIRVQKGPVEKRYEKCNGRHHVLRKGCTSQNVLKSYLKTPGEFIQERKGAAVRHWTPGMRDQRPPTTTCTLPKEPEMHEEHSGWLAGWFPGKRSFVKVLERLWPGQSCRSAILDLVCWDRHEQQPPHPSTLPEQPCMHKQ